MGTRVPGKKRGTATPNVPTAMPPSFLGCPTMALCLTSACAHLHHSKWPCSLFSLSHKTTSLSTQEMVSKATLYVGENIQSIKMKASVSGNDGLSGTGLAFPM